MSSLRHWLVSLRVRFVRLLHRTRLDRDLDDELAFHLAMKAAEHERRGADARQASREARRQFGNVASLKEQSREMWTFPSLESFMQDIRYALRTLRRAPGFTIVAVLALALGIGANSAIFSLVDAVLLRGVPYPSADRLVVLIGNVQRTVVERRGNSFPDHADWRAQASSFDDMAAYTTVTLTLDTGGDPQPITAEAVSAPYFSLLSVAPVSGRVFRAEEDQVANRDAVVVLSDRLWRGQFGADPAIVGKDIRLGGTRYAVVGVMPTGFTGVTDSADMWVPFAMSGTPLANRGSRGFLTLARLKTGVSMAQAQTEMTAIAKRLETAYAGTNEKRGVEVTTLSGLVYGSLSSSVLALMAAVVFVLLIACANVANLLISRAESRHTEMAVRTALGAGRARLLRQLITESCVLAVIGAAAGLALAKLALLTLVSSSPISLPTFSQPELNLTVVLFTIGATGFCGLVLGLVPAFRVRASRVADALRSSRGSTGGASRSARGALVVAEVALTVVLLVGAGLMIRTVRNLSAVEPGFDATGILTLNITVPRLPAPPAPSVAAAPGAPATPPGPPAFMATAADLVDRVKGVPGVTDVSLVTDVPLGGGGSAIFYGAEGDTTTGAQTAPRAYVHLITPEFFQTLRVPFRAGRTFELLEISGASTAVIVSEPLVTRFWPNQNPIGKRIKPGGPTSTAPWMTIVGVVPQLKYRGLPDNPTTDPDIFRPLVDRGGYGMIVRTAGDPAAIEAPVRSAIRQAAVGLVVSGVTPLRRLIESQTAQPRFTSWVLGVFAAAALTLAVIGIYGVMSYLVSQRRREFGIRLALGASTRTIVALVLKHGVKMVMLGVVIGAAAAAALVRLIETMLFDVRMTDPAPFIAVGILALVAIVACAIPAVRAARTNPATISGTE
jgi:predicted permease